MFSNKILPEICSRFYCELCDYKTNKKSSYSDHLISTKHSKSIIGNQNLLKFCSEHICDVCNKKYKDNSGLWRHKKKCNQNLHNNNNNNNNNTDTNITENKEDLIQLLINENKEFKSLIIELVKKDSSITNNIVNSNNNNMINSNNKTFNLQFFLNETCKDAMNMSDFINSLTIQMSDLESVGKLGFVDGISNIIIKNLKALDVEKRPVHCSDSKRETMYIKDQDKWEKEDNELKRMKELVRTVRDKNISMINTWRNLYPECVKSDSKKTTQFNQIYMESFGGETGGEKGTKQEKEEKIISKIAKSVVIDKKE
jgi:hypothetical protein